MRERGRERGGRRERKGGGRERKGGREGRKGERVGKEREGGREGEMNVANLKAILLLLYSFIHGSTPKAWERGSFLVTYM